MSPPEEERRPDPEPDPDRPGGGEQPTEEQFALEAGLPAPTEEHFEGIPPEQLPPDQTLPDSGEFPALEPEFADALRAAGAPPEPPQTESGAEHPAPPESPRGAGSGGPGPGAAQGPRGDR